MTRPCVLVFSGLDPSGGAGIQADIQAISAMGAHPLPIITALTVQDNNHVFAIHPVDASIITAQYEALSKIPIAAVKIGILGSIQNGLAIQNILQSLRKKNPDLPIVLDPVLASGKGDALAKEDMRAMILSLLRDVTVLTPNLPEAAALCLLNKTIHTEIISTSNSYSQSHFLLEQGCQHVFLKGGHDSGAVVINKWFSKAQNKQWQWPRISGEFHGSGCTVAAAIAGCLAHGFDLSNALERAQQYCYDSLSQAFSIATGQRIPQRLAK